MRRLKTPLCQLGLQGKHNRAVPQGRGTSTATLVAVRTSILAGVVVLAACGARTEISGTSGLDASTDAPWETSNSDGESFGQDAMPDAVIDTATCLALPTASCTCGDASCSPPLNTVLHDSIEHCSSPSVFTCGYITVTFDTNGCALSFDYGAADAPASFRACLEDQVGSQRWTCELRQSVWAYLGSCTVH